MGVIDESQIEGLGTPGTPVGGVVTEQLVTAAGTITGLGDGTGNVGLGTSIIATNFQASTNNSTTAQLASGATFTGVIETINNQQAISLLLTSDKSGILTLNQYIDLAGTFKVTPLVYAIVAGIPFSRCIVGNGNFFNLTFKNTDLTATTTLNINTAYGTLPSATNLANNPTSVDEINGIAASARPDGFLKVQIDPTTLLYDPFTTLDTTNVWTPAGTVPPTVSTPGTVSFSPGTAANSTSYMNSKPTFIPPSNAYLQLACLVTLETAIITGNQRFWGLGVITSPTLSAPITNGAVFEIDNVTGKLFGSVYSGGVRTKSLQATLVRPTDGISHRYALYYKASKVYFETDGVQVGSLPFPDPQIDTLSVVMGSVNGATTLAAATSLSATVLSLGDTGRNATQVSDGKFPWRKQTVNASGQAQVQSEQSEVQKATFSASVKGLAAGTTDIFSITGSATKLVKITKINFSGTNTNQVLADIQFIKRSTASSGGTSTAVPAVPHDSNDAAATAAIKAYTVSPTTLGTTVGAIRSAKQFLPTPAPSGSAGIGSIQVLMNDFGNRPAKTLALRGINESIVISLAGTTLTLPSIDIDIEWTEE
jgi:hypothetical protein